MDIRTMRKVASVVVLAAIPTLVAIALDIIILTGRAPTVYLDMVDPDATHRIDGDVDDAP